MLSGVPGFVGVCICVCVGLGASRGASLGSGLFLTAFENMTEGSHILLFVFDM